MDESKRIWVKTQEGKIASLPGCLSSKVREVREAGTSKTSSTVHYIWLHVTQDGIVESKDDARCVVLSLNDWLNIVDESASLGAQWMIIHVETCLKADSDVWRICAWAQEVHGIRVGLHLNHDCMDEAGLAPIRRLDRDATFIVVDKSAIEALEFLQAEGYSVCASNIGSEDRLLPCSHTESIVCACADGVMFCCGMVVGEESYRLGDVQADPVNEAMRKHQTLKPIHMNEEREGHSCDGCPPFMVQRFKEEQAAANSQ